MPSLEIPFLVRVASSGKPVFVDSNLSLDQLRFIAQPGHIAVIATDPQVSRIRFFDRPDAEKNAFLELCREMPDPVAAEKNFRACIDAVCSRGYDDFLTFEFPLVYRDEDRSTEQTLDLLDQTFVL